MKLKLKNTKQESSDVTSFIFEPEGELNFKPGQFLHYTLHHEPTDNRGSDRWFTVSSAPFEKTAKITTRFAKEKGSTFKEALKNLKVGDEIEAEGPEGDFTVDPSTLRRAQGRTELNQSATSSGPGGMVFIAGGIGITPFRSIILQLHHDNQPINVNLLYGNRNQEIVFKDEFEGIQKSHPEFKIHYIISPERIDEATIQRLVSNLQTPIFYVSGPEPMVEALGETLKKMGVTEDHIKQDWFPGYPME